MAGIYINQQIVKTTAEWAGDSTVYPANILLFEKLESGKFSIAVTDGVNTFANLNKVATDIDAYSKEEADERYPQKTETVTKMSVSVFQNLLTYVEGGTMTDNDYNTLSGYAQKDINVYLSEVDTELGAVKVVINNETSNITVILFLDAYTEYIITLSVNKETKEVTSGHKYSMINSSSDGSLEIGSVQAYEGESAAASVKFLTKGEGKKYINDKGEYVDIESRLPYFFNPSALSGLSTNSSYSAESITSMLGMTLRELVANYGDRIVFTNYMGALIYSQDSDGTLAEFTFYKNGAIYVVKIIHEDADTTCDVTVTKKQLVTNIVSMSENGYASLSSKDSSTLYLVY